jgi:hypothetical protein
MNEYHFLFIAFIACLVGCGLGRLLVYLFTGY